MKFKPIILLILTCLLLLSCGRITDDLFGSDQGNSPVTSSDPTSSSDVGRSPLEAIEGEDKMSRSEVFVDSSELVVMESYPLQIVLHVKGNLPTPCHQLRAKMANPNENGEIHIDLYSLVDPEAICIQMLESFESNIQLGSFPDRSYTVWLNGVQVGEFSQ